MYTTLFMVLAGAAVDHVVVVASDRGELGLLPLIPNTRSAGRGLLQDQASSLRLDAYHVVPQASSVCGCVRHQNPSLVRPAQPFYVANCQSDINLTAIRLLYALCLTRLCFKSSSSVPAVAGCGEQRRSRHFLVRSALRGLREHPHRHSTPG